MVLPNQLTVLRIILTPIFLFLFVSGDPTLVQISMVVFLIAALTDWYDGWLARKFNYITDWGKFMDPLADKILTSTAFFGLVSLGMLELWMVTIIVFRDFLITLLRALADYKKVSFSTSRLAQWKTAVQMVFLYYVLVFYTFRTHQKFADDYKWLFNSVLNTSLIYYCMLVVTLFTAVTGIIYLLSNWILIKRMLKSEN